MNTKTSVVTFLTLALIFVTCLSSCERARQVISPESSTLDAASTIKIGMIHPSGIVPSVIDGARLAETQINDRGGVLGMQVELIVKDNQGTRERPDEAESLRFAKELIEQEGVVAMIGPLFSTISEKVGPVVNQLGIPMIPTSSGQNVTTIGGEFVFLVVAPSSAQGAAVAQFALDATELNAKTAAIILEAEDSYAMNIAGVFEENFKQLGGTIVANETYQKGDQTFDTQLANIKAKSPDALFISGFYPEVRFVMEQSRKMGIEATFIGGDSWEPDKLLGADDTTPFEKSYFVTELPNTAPFAEAYTIMFMAPPDIYAAWGYDALSLLATAMENAGTLEPTAVRDALAGVTDYQGAAAIAGYDANRHPIKSIGISTIRAGEIVPHTIVELGH